MPSKNGGFSLKKQIEWENFLREFLMTASNEKLNELLGLLDDECFAGLKNVLVRKIEGGGMK